MGNGPGFSTRISQQSRKAIAHNRSGDRERAWSADDDRSPLYVVPCRAASAQLPGWDFFRGVCGAPDETHADEMQALQHFPQPHPGEIRWDSWDSWASTLPLRL